MNTKIWLSSPHIGNNELQYVNEAFATNWIAPLGPHVNAFEQGLQEKSKLNMQLLYHLALLQFIWH